MINWINNLLVPSQKMTNPKITVRNALPTAYMNPVSPLEGQFGQSQQQGNPFMTALKPESSGYKDTYGVNRPLDKPMFLGYRDNKALYGGAKLFILY